MIEDDGNQAISRTLAVRRVVMEIEKHVSSGGWDGPDRVFALVRTAGALARDPGLADRLPPEAVADAAADPEHLTAVEQPADDLPTAETLTGVLEKMAWPETVDGAAVVFERTTVPPEHDADMPADPQAAVTWAQNHPRRRELRIAAAALRSGEHAGAIRARDHDSDDDVVANVDLVPDVEAAIGATLKY
jgi:hypothetical protein